MKKTYAKPEIMFESFSMSTNIAAECEAITDLPSKNACGYPTRKGIIFVSKETGCGITHEGYYTDGDNTFCYDVPIASSNLFNS